MLVVIQVVLDMVMVIKCIHMDLMIHSGDITFDLNEIKDYMFSKI